MSDRWSDLMLWPAKAEVSPLREEPEVLCLLCGEPDPVHAPTCSSVHLAVARSTDPGTSWEAARSITPEKLRESQELVLHVLQVWGPMNDEQLVERLTNRSHQDGRMSPSGARSRRSELVAMGLVRDSGHKDTLRSGRRAIVWEAVPDWTDPKG